MYLIQFTIQYNANRDILKPRNCYRGFKSMLSGTYFDFAVNFALKMTKIFTLYSNMIHQLVGVEGMLIPGEYCKMVQFGVYFDTILP